MLSLDFEKWNFDMGSKNGSFISIQKLNTKKKNKNILPLCDSVCGKSYKLLPSGMFPGKQFPVGKATYSVFTMTSSSFMLLYSSSEYQSI